MSTQLSMSSLPYAGPAGIILTPDELLIIWSLLCRLPTAENAPLRRRIERYLEDGPQDN